MALNPEQIAALRDACGQIAEPVTAWLLRDAAERIAGAGKMTSTAAYELYRANALGQSKRALKKFLKKQLGLSERQIRRLFQQTEMWSVRNDLERLKLGPFTWISPQLKEITNAAIQMATVDFRNLTQSLGMVSKSGQVLPLQQFYRESMDFAFKQVFTGAADYETAIRQTTAKLASQGLRVIDYQSGRHSSIEAATRRNMMGAMGLLDEQITQRNHDLLGCNGWEISAHANSAPDHEPYQGRQYSDADYEQLNNSLARRIGTLNCGHTASPIILGVNSPQYTKEELEKFKSENAKGFTYQGRHYTGYEATQKQRQLETAIRGQKNRILVAEAAGDEKTLQTARIKYQLLNREYREFSKAAGLRTQDQRALTVGFGPGEARRASAEYKDVAIAANSMYNAGSEAGNVRAWLRDKPLRDRITGGEFPLSIRTGQQNKHIPGTHEFEQYAQRLKDAGQFGPSRLTIGSEEISVLVEKYHGTGILLRDKAGEWRRQERITMHPDVIGISVNNLTGQEADTTTFTIHYSQSGVHLVPDYPSKKGELGKS